jgi:hypothetical protein
MAKKQKPGEDRATIPIKEPAQEQHSIPQVRTEGLPSVEPPKEPTPTPTPEPVKEEPPKEEVREEPKTAIVPAGAAKDISYAPQRKTLTPEEFARLIRLEDRIVTGLKDVLEAILELRYSEGPHGPLWRDYGTWEDYCWMRFGHGRDWAAKVVIQARLQRLMDERMPGKLVQVTQWDAKVAGKLEPYPDLLVACYETALREQKTKRKPADVFKEQVERFSKFLRLKQDTEQYPDLTAEEMGALADLDCDRFGEVAEAASLSLRARDAIREELGLPLRDSCVLDEYRGDALLALVPQYRPLKEKEDKQDRDNMNHKKEEDKKREQIALLKQWYGKSKEQLTEALRQVAPGMTLVPLLSAEQEANARDRAGAEADRLITAATGTEPEPGEDEDQEPDEDNEDQEPEPDEDEEDQDGDQDEDQEPEEKERPGHTKVELTIRGWCPDRLLDAMFRKRAGLPADLDIVDEVHVYPCALKDVKVVGYQESVD